MTFPKLEKAIRDACPETMEFSSGVIIQAVTSKKLYRVNEIFNNGNITARGLLSPEYSYPEAELGKLLIIGGGYESLDFVSSYKIIGHELTLAHVLRAIKVAQDKYSISVDENGLFYTYNPDDGCWEESKGMVTFDLTKDLDGQSDETKEWLEKIIY